MAVIIIERFIGENQRQLKTVMKRKLPGHHFVYLADNNMSAVIYFIAL